MIVLLKVVVFLCACYILSIIVRAVRSRRRKRVKPLKPLPQYEDLIARSGVDALRRNPCDVDGCLIRLGTRCGECGVTLYDCEINGDDGCDNCGSAEIVRDPVPVYDVSDFPDLEIER